MNIHFGHETAARVFLHDALYSDMHDRQKHLGNMLAIADELDRPIEEIVELYEEVLMHLKAQASIPDYLPVLVSKRIKRLYRRH